MSREIAVPLVLLVLLVLLLAGCACAPGVMVSKDTDGVGALSAYVECDL